MRDIWYLVLPLIISALITPVVKQIGYRLDAFAQMNERTVHHGKIVRIGGVAIYLAFIITMALYVKTDMAMNGILIGSTIMFIGGLVDDLVNLKPLYKFSFQVVAAIVLIASGVTLDVIRLPLGITINMGVVSFIVTFFWITGITNAVNLIDGLDGLCGGISVIILTVIAMLAVIEGRGDVEMIALILVGATLGFLLYNAHPASIFMGDCGALFLGFIISAISLLGFKSSTIMTLALPLLLLALPIIDTLSAILRRTLKGHKFSEADKSHIHHLLMNKFGHKNTVIIMCIVTALFGLTAYVYMINKGIGLISLFVIMLAVDLFIEGSGMISDKYHPILSVSRRIIRRLTSSKRSSAAIVISAISRAIAAPSLIAMPTSAAERAGESLIPSPSMMTVCPCARSASTNRALSSGRTSEWYSSTPTCAAIAAAVRSLSPVSTCSRSRACTYSCVPNAWPNSPAVEMVSP